MKDLAKVTLSVGSTTIKQMSVVHSYTEVVRVTRTTMPRNILATIIAVNPEFTKVCIFALVILNCYRVNAYVRHWLMHLMVIIIQVLLVYPFIYILW